MDASGNLLLAAFAPAEFVLLAPHLKRVALVQDMVLYEENGGPAELAYFPVSGIVSVMAVMNNGAAIEIVTIGRDGAVGLPIGAGPAKIFGRAQVLVGGSAVTISNSILQGLIRQHERVRDPILAYQATLLAQIEQTAACNALHPIEMRLARWLLQADDRIDDGSLPLTQETLSQLLGVRRTTITLIANKLQDDGYVRCHRGHIDIVDRDKLEAHSCECYGNMRRRSSVEITRPAAAVRR